MLSCSQCFTTVLLGFKFIRTHLWPIILRDHEAHNTAGIFYYAKKELDKGKHAELYHADNMIIWTAVCVRW